MLGDNKIYHLSFLYKLVIDDNQISATYDLRTRSLAWHEITNIRPNPKGGGLLLSNSSEDTTIFINPNLRDYEEVVGIIQGKCPTAWMAKDIDVFHYSPFRMILFGAMGLSTLSYPVFFLPAIRVGLTFRDFSFIAVSVVAGLLMLLYAFTAKQRLVFRGNSIIFKYILWERRINADEIALISIDKPIIVSIFNKPLHFTVRAPYIELRNGKTIDLDTVTEGIPILWSKIEKWMKAHIGLTTQQN